mgnify:CR=1 FL=1
MPEQQTTFSVGHDHFSQTHAIHHGCKDPLQRDLELRNEDGKVIRKWGTPSPKGTVIQTTLDKFKS